MTVDQRRTGGRAAAALGVALVAAIALSACGGGTSSSNTTSAASAGAPPSGAGGFAAERSQLTACLRKHGVTLPAGSFGGPRLGATGRFGGPGRFGATGRFGFGRYGGGRVLFGGTGRFGPTGPSSAAIRVGRAFAANPKYAAAFRACAGGFGGGFVRRGGSFSARSAADRTAVEDYVACVRRNGFALPNPNLSGNGPVFSSSQVSPTNPKFLAASRPCASLLQFQPNGGAPPSGAS